MTDPDLEQVAEKAKHAQLEIITHAYDRSAAYTNLIILGGYAGAFAIWTFTREQLTATSGILVAMLLAVSLAFFVFFEVYKMVFSSRYLLKQRTVLTSQYPPKDFLIRLQAIQQEANHETIRWMLPLWVIHMVICVTTSLLAVGLLFYNFTAVLLGWPGWPR